MIGPGLLDINTNYTGLSATQEAWEAGITSHILATNTKDKRYGCTIAIPS